MMKKTILFSKIWGEHPALGAMESGLRVASPTYRLVYVVIRQAGGGSQGKQEPLLSWERQL